MAEIEVRTVQRSTVIFTGSYPATGVDLKVVLAGDPGVLHFGLLVGCPVLAYFPGRMILKHKVLKRWWV